MYPKYFGLKESSFSITPDPHYLFLSDEHREALAHLIYGTGNGGGFVLLTGEVGTGKTTICRAFLEQLPERVDVALILNPALTAAELLQTVCDEFAIDIPPGIHSSKILIDHLNLYLLEAHAAGKRPVLIIDEAQNLRPDVLEQIRLLTNLETHHHKLLQIFLIGQPELRQILQQPQLRQLSQRITARYHLLPLDAKETEAYIRHRLKVAGTERQLFTPAAIRRIFRLTGGVPRLINILCDRALLGAFATGQECVDWRIVSRAARELNGERMDRKPKPPLKTLLLALSILLVGIAPPLYLWQQQAASRPPENPASAAAPRPQQRLVAPETGIEVPEAPIIAVATLPLADREAAADSAPATRASSVDEPTPRPAVAPKPVPEPPAAPQVAAPAVQLADLMMTARPALSRLLALWGIDEPVDDATPPCLFARQQGLRCRDSEGSWNQIIAYDRPLLIWLDDKAGKSGYGLVLGMNGNQLIMQQGDQHVSLPRSAVQPYWTGRMRLLWKPPPGGETLIGPSSAPGQIRWLREMLSRIPGWSIEQPGENPGYSKPLQQAIRRFQRQQGLQVDGLVGPETLIHLNTAAAVPGIPHLQTP
jgi:general secretion pathway protein A